MSHTPEDDRSSVVHPAHDETIPSATAPRNATEAVDKVMNDTEFLSEFPEDSSAFGFKKLRSHSVLVALLVGGIYGAYAVLGVEILGSWPASVAIGLIILVGIYTTGGHRIDWWSLLVHHWWLSLPIGAAAGVALLVMGENATSLQETS